MRDHAFAIREALRQCGGNAHLAEDVVQRVFTDLARRSRSLSGYTVLGGWLYRRAQFVASDIVRADHRRRAREQEAQAMQDVSRPAVGDAEWQKLAPVLDQAIGELPERDRDAVVLRFIEALLAAGLATVAVDVHGNRGLHAELRALQASGENLGALSRENQRLNAALQKSSADNPEAGELVRMRQRAVVLKARPPGVLDGEMISAASLAALCRQARRSFSASV